MFWDKILLGKLKKKKNPKKYETTLPASWEVCMQVKKLEQDMEQQTCFKLGMNMSRLYIVTLLI